MACCSLYDEALKLYATRPSELSAIQEASAIHLRASKSFCGPSCDRGHAGVVVAERCNGPVAGVDLLGSMCMLVCWYIGLIHGRAFADAGLIFSACGKHDDAITSFIEVRVQGHARTFHCVYHHGVRVSLMWYTLRQSQLRCSWPVDQGVAMGIHRSCTRPLQRCANSGHGPCCRGKVHDDRGHVCKPVDRARVLLEYRVRQADNMWTALLCYWHIVLRLQSAGRARDAATVLETYAQDMEAAIQTLVEGGLLLDALASAERAARPDLILTHVKVTAESTPSRSTVLMHAHVLLPN